MAHPKAAWGIEIGAFAIKAIRLERNDDQVTVSDFAVIPHKKVLTSPDLDQDEMIRLGLGQFISQKSLEGEHLVMSVPGHSAFARFAKLPPVEPKKVPDIVKFEAVQQIPFPIDQVEWDYQTFAAKDSPEIEVGIFAITRERVQQRLSLYGDLGITPESLTLSPVALFNAMAYEGLTRGQKGPVIFLDIGTSATDVIIAEENRCWIRTFPLGGTHFTDAIANSFKLSYSKAEKLKLEASTSKYAKQIMQAMRPVFSDLLQDLQRSIGYYQSVHREAELTTTVGVGSTFKIPGLRKFLGQQLQIDVIRLDEYKKISVTGREAASFAENAVNMATAYGLALQGVGLGEISVNLVPVKALRDQMWHSRTKWFAAAAAISVVGSAMLLWTPLRDGRALDPGGVPTVVTSTLTRGNEYKQRYDTLKASSDPGGTAASMRKLLDFRTVWPYLVNDAAMALESSRPQPELLATDLAAIQAIPSDQRRLVQLTHLDGSYIPPEANGKRRIKVTMDLQLTFSKDARPEKFINDTVGKWLRENAERDGVPYTILVDKVSVNPSELYAVIVPAAGDAVQGSNPATPVRPIQPGTAGNKPKPPAGSVGKRGGDSGGDGGPLLAPGAGVVGTASATGGGGDTRQPDNPSATPESAAGTDGMPKPEIDAATLDLETLAPVPPAPELLPPGSTYYLLPVTFEVELKDEPAAQPAATASGTPVREGSAT